MWYIYNDLRTLVLTDGQAGDTNNAINESNDAKGSNQRGH